MFYFVLGAVLAYFSGHLLHHTARERTSRLVKRKRALRDLLPLRFELAVLAGVVVLVVAGLYFHWAEITKRGGEALALPGVLSAWVWLAAGVVIGLVVGGVFAVLARRTAPTGQQVAPSASGTEYLNLRRTLLGRVGFETSRRVALVVVLAVLFIIGAHIYHLSSLEWDSLRELVFRLRRFPWWELIGGFVFGALLHYWFAVRIRGLYRFSPTTEIPSDPMQPRRFWEHEKWWMIGLASMLLLAVAGPILINVAARLSAFKAAGVEVQFGLGSGGPSRLLLSVLNQTAASYSSLNAAKVNDLPKGSPLIIGATDGQICELLLHKTELSEIRFAGKRREELRAQTDCSVPQGIGEQLAWYTGDPGTTAHDRFDALYAFRCVYLSTLHPLLMRAGEDVEGGADLGEVRDALRPVLGATLQLLNTSEESLNTSEESLNTSEEKGARDSKLVAAYRHLKNEHEKGTEKLKKLALVRPDRRNENGDFPKCEIDPEKFPELLRFFGRSAMSYEAASRLSDSVGNTRAGLALMKRASRHFPEEILVAKRLGYYYSYLYPTKAKAIEWNSQAESLVNKKLDRFHVTSLGDPGQRALVEKRLEKGLIVYWNELAYALAEEGKQELRARRYAERLYKYAQEKERNYSDRADYLDTYAYVLMTFAARREPPDTAEIEKALGLFREAKELLLQKVPDVFGDEGTLEDQVLVQWSYSSKAAHVDQAEALLAESRR